MKKLKFWFMSISIMSITLLVLSIFPHIAYAETGNFTYNIGENGILITGYSGEYSDLIIPNEIDGQAVIGISNGAFSYSSTLESIVIPDSVTYIGDSAFSNCSYLTSARFLGDAPSIGEEVFSNASTEFKIYYDLDNNGFSNPWNGFITEVYISSPEITPIPNFISVTGITLDKSSTALMVGESQILLSSISPTDATNKNIIWTSSNTDVVIVDETGAIYPISEGNAIITATAEDGGYTATCSVNVLNKLAAPKNQLAVPQNYDAIKVYWSAIPDATGYEVNRLDATSGEYIKIATVQFNEFKDTGLKTGSVYYYKVRAFKTINDITIYSDYTPIITVKTLDKSIGSTLFLYMSNLNNRNSVYERAVELHYGDPRNTCAYTVSEAFRRLGMDIPNSTNRTNQVESHLKARGWKREMNLNLLQPGDICFTTDRYGNLLGGHSTHVFIFMGWANKEKTLMNICDNQVSRFGSVLHTRSIYETSITDATAFFYHTDLSSVGLILKLPSTVNADPISYNKVKITWKEAESAYGYKIYRSTSKYGYYNDIATTSTTSYIDTNVLTGKTYYYKVRAYSYVDTSRIYGTYSDILSSTPSLSVPSVNVKSNYDGKVKLAWNEVKGGRGYQIYRSSTKNGSYSYVTSTSSTSYSKAGLVKGKDYYYKVRAYRYVGNKKVYSKYSYVHIKAL